MGACLSCCGEDNSRTAAETNERTHLLVDPVSSTSNNIHRVQSDEYLSRTPKQLPRKDEQSALSRILDQTASNVIDVSALNSHDLEQHEYHERMRAYDRRLNALPRWSPPSKPAFFLVDVPSTEVLATDPMSPQFMYLITNAIDSITDAVAQIRVEHKEDLVVPFTIP